MELQNRVFSDCVIVDIIDDKFSYPKTLLLKSHVTHILENGQRNIIINLGAVEMMDSFGLAVLISLLKLCKENRGKLTLYGLTTQVSRLIEMTHMDRVLDIWDSEAQALSQVVAG